LTGVVLLVRQYLNKKDTDKKLGENTEVTHEVKVEAVAARAESKEALLVANGHNAKIAEATQLSAKAAEISTKALERIEAIPLEVHVNNGPKDPVPTISQAE